MKRGIFVMVCMSMVVGLAGAETLFQPTGDPFSSGLRNNFSGQFGFLFGTAGPVEVDALGFFDEGEDGLAVDHQVRLYEWFKTTTGEINLVAEVTISAGTGNVLSDGFRWADLSETITIESQELGHWYILASTHAASDGDSIYDFDWTYANTGFDFNSSIMNTGIWYDARWGSSTAAEDPPLGGAYNGSAYYSANLSGTPVVPEPATMVLLGLGALVIRRRK